MRNVISNLLLSKKCNESDFCYFRIILKIMARPIFVTFTLILLSFCSIAQTVNQAISDQFKKYSQFVIDKNFEEAVHYTMDDIFTIIPKDQFVLLMKKTMSTPGLSYKTSLPVPSDFQQLKIINGKNYIRFISSSVLEIKIDENEADKDKTQEEKRLKKTLQKVAFENQFGASNVTYDEGSGFFKINTKKNVIARSDAKLIDWQFAIVDNENQKKLLARFLPAEILE